MDTRCWPWAAGAQRHTQCYYSTLQDFPEGGVRPVWTLGCRWAGGGCGTQWRRPGHTPPHQLQHTQELQSSLGSHSLTQTGSCQQIKKPVLADIHLRCCSWPACAAAQKYKAWKPGTPPATPMTDVTFCHHGWLRAIFKLDHLFLERDACFCFLSSASSCACNTCSAAACHMLVHSSLDTMICRASLEALRMGIDIENNHNM